MTRHTYLIGNKHAQKKHPRDGHLHCRFNTDILARIVAQRLEKKSLADYLEGLVLEDLDSTNNTR